MKLKEIFKRLDMTIPPKTGEIPKEVMRLVQHSDAGRSLSSKAAKTDNSLENLLEKVLPDSVLSPGAHFHSITLDTSTTGFSAVLDGKQRLAWFLLFVSKGRMSADIDLPVVQINCGANSEDDMADNHWFIHPARIREFLLRHWQSADRGITSGPTTGVSSMPREEVISHFTRRIVRHLSSISNSGSHASESALLALTLSRYLPQVRIAEILRRSEAWVSAACSLGQLEEQYLAALENNTISYSAALLLAEAQMPEERALLFELATAHKLTTRSLRVALQFLRLNDGFARRTDALAKLLKLLSERLISLKDNYFARLKLIFRNRRPLWQIRFFHKKKKIAVKDNLQTGSEVTYRGLLQKLQDAEAALAQFPL